MSNFTISNAKDRPIYQGGGLPNMSATLTGWFQTLTFTKITTQIIDHQAKETEEPIITSGVRQPFSPQQLKILPQGQRAWKWEMIHAVPSLVLEVDDIIVFGGNRYRVMERLDYTEYGYVQYNICQGYENEPT